MRLTKLPFVAFGFSTCVSSYVYVRTSGSDKRVTGSHNEKLGHARAFCLRVVDFDRMDTKSSKYANTVVLLSSAQTNSSVQIKIKLSAAAGRRNDFFPRGLQPGP